MSKLLKTTITSLVILFLVAILTTVGVLYFTKETTEGAEQSIDDMNEFSVETPEVTTDLKDGSFVRIQFKLITDGKKALKEAEKREFQIKNILIKELAILTEDDFNAGLSDLEITLQDKLNEVMDEGTITDVFTISKILQ